MRKNDPIVRDQAAIAKDARRRLADLETKEYTAGGITEAEADALYAPIAKGVTNGDSHDHSGGDGGLIPYTSLTGTPTIPSQYTDELAQDAVGGMLLDTATIDLTYTDGTPSLEASVKADSISNTLLANMAESTIKGRAAAAGTGDPTDLSAAQVLTLINVEAAADVTDAANVSGAGAVMATGDLSVGGLKIFTALLTASAGLRVLFDANSYFDFLVPNATTAQMNFEVLTGAPTVDINAKPGDGSSDASFRFFRSTNTSGVVGIKITRGDNSTNANSFLGGNASSYFNALLGNVGIGKSTSINAKLDVSQASTTAAIPTLALNQADLDQPMIEFIGTIGTGNVIEAVGAKTLTVTHFIMVKLPGGLTRYLPVGTIA